MIEDYFLSQSLVTCPNEECGYLGELSEFEQDFDEDEEDLYYCFDVPCKCPKCKQRFTAHCDPYVEYWVNEEIKE